MDSWGARRIRRPTSGFRRYPLPFARMTAPGPQYLTYLCIYDMLLHMRTTLRLNDGLFRQVKRLAAETHRTLTAVFEDALREMLARRQKSGRARPEPSPVFHGRGFSPAWTWITARACWISWRAGMVLIDVNILLYAFRSDSPPQGLPELAPNP